MPRIDGPRLTALLRVQLDAIRQTEAAEKLRHRKPVGAPGVRDGRAYDHLDSIDSATLLRQRIGLAVRSIQPDDPERKRKALRAFLEAILLQEFGQDLKADPAFDAMVSQVQERMEHDETLQSACTRASDALLALAHGGPLDSAAPR